MTWKAAMISRAFDEKRNAALDVPLRERPPFLNWCDDGGFYFSGGMVMRSVHKFVYGHKFEGTATTSVVA
jgi:hypothetical protein